MLRARTSDGSFILGLDAENVRRLKKGKPILVRLPEMGGTDTVLLMYGETLADVRRELEQSIGRPLPIPTEIKKGSKEP